MSCVCYAIYCTCDVQALVAINFIVIISGRYVNKTMDALVVLLVPAAVAYLVYNKAKASTDQAFEVYFHSQLTLKSTVESSPYFYRMSPSDLIARGFAKRTAIEYRTWYLEQILEWSPTEKQHMTRVAQEAELRIRSSGILPSALPWRFVKASASLESGYPHTLGDSIVWNESLADKPFLSQVKTAIHEMVHVWQRIYPVQWRDRLERLGYRRIPGMKLLIRNNPDTNNVLWAYKDKSEVLGSTYRSRHPKSIADITGSDHPNELLAYQLANRAMQ